MRMSYNGSGEQRHLVDWFVDKFEAMAFQYVFTCWLDMRASFNAFNSGDLVFTLKWTPGANWAGDGITYQFEATVTYDELKALDQEPDHDFDVYVYHFVRMMLSSLALSLKKEPQS